MTHIYLKLIAPFLGVLIVLAIIARVLGSAQPPNPALRGFVEGCEGKPQPCWYGIVPEATTRTDTEKIGEKLSIVTCRIEFYYDESGETNINVGFHACDGIQYGDLLVQYLAMPADSTTIYVNCGGSFFCRVTEFSLEVRHPVTLIPVN